MKISHPLGNGFGYMQIGINTESSEKRVCFCQLLLLLLDPTTGIHYLVSAAYPWRMLRSNKHRGT